MEFKHKQFKNQKDTKVIFIGMSKKTFYFRRHAVKYILEKGFTPISQYGIFDYFLTDVVDRNLIRNANYNLIRVSDEFWVFGPISDGVLTEIILVKKMNKPVRYFKIEKSKHIKEISKEEVEFEDNLEDYKNEL